MDFFHLTFKILLNSKLNDPSEESLLNPYESLTIKIIAFKYQV